MSKPTQPSPAPDLERYVIPNLRNACRILKLLGENESGLKAADLSRMLHIPVTTTLRIMATLQLEGFVRKKEALHVLGPLMIRLGTASLANTEIRSVALPVLGQLTAVTDETSHLAIPCDQKSLIVAVQSSPHPLRASSQPGFLAELHCSSTGKTFLAYLYHETLAAMYGKTRPTKRTAHTLITLPAIRREVEIIQKRGYSLDDEEFNLGVRCLAAPVYSSDGTVVAAMGITAPTVRFTRERIPEMAAAVTTAARELSHLLGHSGN